MSRQVWRANGRRNAFRELNARYGGPRKIRRALARRIGHFVAAHPFMAKQVTFDELLAALGV